MTTHIVCLQTVYSTQGSSASWEWLEMVSPCVNILRCLVSVELLPFQVLSYQAYLI